MTVTNQLTESEFNYQLFKRIKSQFARRRTVSFNIRIEVKELDETETIMANPYLAKKLKSSMESFKSGNFIEFTPKQFDELVKKHSI
jgi:hypothetical protein